MSFGAPHRHFRETDSTNTRARELAEAGAPQGTIITAGRQSAGRGRQGRTWTAPAEKALLYSAILRPLDQRHLLLPLAIPLAVCETAEELNPDIACRVKWPNDVWVEERKLAGVLIEARPQDGWAVLGIGLNLSIAPDEFPPELRDKGISFLRLSHRASGWGPPEQQRGGSVGPHPDALYGSRSPKPSPSALGRSGPRRHSRWLALARCLEGTGGLVGRGCRRRRRNRGLG